MKKALLLVNLGTPDKPTYFSVFRYLRQFLMDGRVININPFLRFILVNFIICPTRSFSSTKVYKEVWDEIKCYKEKLCLKYIEDNLCKLNKIKSI